MEYGPQVLGYLDYRLYLRDWYQYQKEKNPHFSFAVWAQKAGFKSRSFIRLVMLGKRSLGVDSIAQLLQSLDLNKNEREYFAAMVHYNHATSFEGRDHYFNQLLKLSKQTHPSLVKDTFRFFAHHKTPRVHLLVSLKNLECTVEMIAKTLALTISETKDILENLQRCGLSYFDQDSKTWKGASKDLSISDDLGNLALQSFHLQSLKEAQEAMNLPVETRHFGSLLLTLTTEEYAGFKQDLNQFMDYMVRKYESKNLSQARIYQFNTNIIPTSEELIRDTNSKRESKDSQTSNDLSEVIL